MARDCIYLVIVLWGLGIYARVAPSPCLHLSNFSLKLCTLVVDTTVCVCVCVCVRARARVRVFTTQDLLLLSYPLMLASLVFYNIVMLLATYLI